MFDADDEAAHTRRALTNIARALDLPLSAFLPRPRAELTAPSAAEERELIGLFRSIRDPSVRRDCLDLMRTMAGSSSA